MRHTRKRVGFRPRLDGADDILGRVCRIYMVSGTPGGAYLSPLTRVRGLRTHYYDALENPRMIDTIHYVELDRKTAFTFIHAS
jgi:hypothetical protein